MQWRALSCVLLVLRAAAANEVGEGDFVVEQGGTDFMRHLLSWNQERTGHVLQEGNNTSASCSSEVKPCEASLSRVPKDEMQIRELEWHRCFERFCTCRPGSWYSRTRHACLSDGREDGVCTALEVCLPTRTFCQDAVREKVLSQTLECRKLTECKKRPEVRSALRQDCIKNLMTNFPDYQGHCDFNAACDSEARHRSPMPTSGSTLWLACAAGLPALLCFCALCFCWRAAQCHQRAHICKGAGVSTDSDPIATDKDQDAEGRADRISKEQAVL